MSQDSTRFSRRRPGFPARGLLRPALCALALVWIGGAAPVQAAPVSIGARVGVGGAGHYSAHATYGWGMRQGIRLGYETGIGDHLFVSLGLNPRTDGYRSYSATVSMTSLSYEYSVTGHQARNTFFIGGGPAYFHGRASGWETASPAPSGNFYLTGAANSVWTYGLATYMGYRAGIGHGLVMSAEVRGRWSNDCDVILGQRIMQFDFDGLAGVFGFDLKF